MARSDRPSAAATARKPHARAFARAPIFWRAHGARERAMRQPLRQRTVNATASLCNALKMLHNDA
eukprot:9751071-Lingulodinium_polyedra.AAC.1